MDYGLIYEKLQAEYLIYLSKLGQGYKTENIYDENFNNLYAVTQIFFKMILPLYGNGEDIKNYIYAVMIPSLKSIAEPKRFVLSALEYLKDISRHYSSIKLSLPRLALLGANGDIISFLNDYIVSQKNVIYILNNFVEEDGKADINYYKNGINDFYFLQAEIHRLFSILLSKTRDNVMIIETLK